MCVSLQSDILYSMASLGDMAYRVLRAPAWTCSSEGINNSGCSLPGKKLEILSRPVLMRAIGSGGGFGIGDHSVDSCNLMD